MTGETKDDIKKYLETNENENTMNYLKPMGHNKSSSKKEVSSSTNLPQEIKKISNKPRKLRPKATRERRTNKTQSQQKERNHKDQSRNKLEMKKTIESNNETKSWLFEKINKIQPDLSRKKKGRGLKSIKLKMKKGNLQWAPQKYKGS